MINVLPLFFVKIILSGGTVYVIFVDDEDVFLGIFDCISWR